MNSETKRYSGPTTVKQAYMDEFLVVCPKCKKDALVTVKNPWTLTQGKLSCFNCMHSEKAADLVRYKLIVNRNCDNCGKAVKSVIPDQKEKTEKIAVSCPHCNITRTFKPKNEIYLLTYKNKSKYTDPVFNLSLWLQASVKGNVFWSYNRQHMNDIKIYVAAKLRERQTAQFTTMVEKLPTFIKIAKNRESILKTIEKLENKRA